MVHAADDAALRTAMRARGNASRRGWYEVHYVTAALPGGRAVWLRWTLSAPNSGAATCAVWGVAFDAARPRWFAGRRTLDGTRWMALPGGGVRIGSAEVSPAACRGDVADAAGRRLRWNLHWDVAAAPFAYFPTAFERAAAGATFPIVTMPLGHATGMVEVDGERIDCAGVPVEHSHLFGGHHAHRWGWLHALGFDDDAGAWLTLVWAVPHRLGGRLPPLSSLALHAGGREHRASGAGALRAVRWFDLGSDVVTFAGRAGAAEVEGEVRVPPERLTGVTYHDPDGSEVFCDNTEVADLTLTVREPGRAPLHLRCLAACGFERGARMPAAGVWRPL